MKEDRLVFNSINLPVGFDPFPEYALNGTYVDRFEEMVNRYPENIAVTHLAQSVTYQELNAAANKLAWEILDQRSSQTENVGFMAVQDLDSVITILGILKAGKTYVPFSPTFPVDRLQALITEIHIPFLITTPAFTTLCAELKTRIPSLDIFIARKGESGRFNNPGILISQDVHTYLGYTSGSTGKPKIISHHTRGLMDQQRVKANEFGLLASDRWAVFNPLSFGGGAFSLFGALLNGAAACLYNISSQGMEDIPSWVEEQGITVINMPPPVFRSAFGNLPAEKILHCVRLIILSGDTMISQDVKVCRQHFYPNCILSNMLAITETGIACRAFINLSAQTEHTIPVGYPFDGVEITLVDETGQATAPGQVGEIVVKTRYITLDPLNPSDLLSGKVRIDPVNGLRSVLTGDLGRFRENGSLEYIGRKDSVIKIRGLRVETAEVEAILYQHHKVKDAAVITMQAKPSGENVLVAYIVAQPGSFPSLKELRSRLSISLPYYMVPSRFVFLDQIPLNPNGKVDRQKLPEPDWNHFASDDVYVAPRNSVEWLLSQIWRDLLKLKRVGIRHDFFALGGDSLLALQLMTRIESQLKIRLPLQTLVANPTIADLANLISELVPIPIQTSTVELRSDGGFPALFMVPGGSRTGLSLIKFASRLNSHYKIYALEYPGMDGYLEPMDQIESLAEFFVHQIQNIQPHGPFYLAGPCLGGVIVFEMARQLVSAGEEVGLLAMLDSTPPASTSGERTQRTISSSFHSSLSLLRTGQGELLWKKGKSRLRRNKTLFLLWKRIQKITHKTPQQEWLTHRLDAQSWRVMEKLQVAQNLYTPLPFSGRGMVILSEVAKGTPRQQLWGQLLKDMECFYIPETNHSNIFDVDHSLDQIARLINDRIPKK
jgi:acyl-coenzyme A synthetase/AMP-(fatty) acid ligase/thioesterase domain-containing protein